MPLQTVSAQSGEATKGSVDLQNATVQVAQKAIPAAAPIELISHGKAEHGWLGVSVQELTPELAKSLDMDIPKGS